MSVQIYTDKFVVQSLPFEIKFRGFKGWFLPPKRGICFLLVQKPLFGGMGSDIIRYICCESFLKIQSVMSTRFYISIIMSLIMSLFVFFPAYAQEHLVEMEKELENTSLSVEEKLQLYDDLSWEYLGSDFAKSSFYAREGIRLAHKENNLLKEGLLYRNLGVAYYMKSSYDTASVYYDKALRIAEEEKNIHLQAAVSLAFANMYNVQCQPEKALAQYQKAISLYEKEDDRQRICAILGNIGAMYNNLRNYAQAESYILQAQKIAKELNDTLSIAQACNNLKIIRYAQERYEEGLQLAEEARSLYKAKGDMLNEAFALHGIATVYFDYYKDYAKARAYAEEALGLTENTGYPVYSVASYRILARVHELAGNIPEAERYANKALAAVDSTDLDQLISIHNILMDIAIDKGEKEKAKTAFQVLYKLMLDNNSEITHAALADMEVKYETEKKEALIETLHASERLYLIIAVIGLVSFVLALTVLLLLNRYQRQKQLRMKEVLKQLEQEKQLVAVEALLSGENQERGRLSRELHDGLGGLLTMAKLDLSKLRQEKEKEKDRLEHIIGLMDRSITEMRRLAHNLMPESLARFGLRPVLEEFCSGSSNVEFYFYGKERRLDKDVEINIYRIACELINNALKHAEATQINVQLIQADDSLSLTVQDDGKGFEGSAEGQGLTTVRSRAELLGATLNIVSGKGRGTEITIGLNC